VGASISIVARDKREEEAPGAEDKLDAPVSYRE
jgi:hypothetical protein